MRLIYALLLCALVTITHDVLSQALQLQTMVAQAPAHFRGMSIVDDNVGWVSGTKGIVGRSIDGGKQWTFTPVRGFEGMDFRSLYAFDSLNAVVANAGSPAYILRTTDGGRNWKTVYTNSHPQAFIDGVDFWNEREGLMYGDAINGRMLLIRTTDGGMTWSEIPESLRPELKEGEGSFAASGTNIRCMQSGKTFIATGGQTSRFFISADKGNTWTVTHPPIIQGKTMTGIFSMAFKSDNEGIIVGGNYEIDSLKQDHMYLTTDGGKSWQKPSRATRGIREGSEFLTHSLVVATGYPGIDYSTDGGRTWLPLSNERGYAVIRKARKGNLVVLAGKSVSILQRK